MIGKRVGAAALVAALSLVVSGCGSDGEDVGRLSPPAVRSSSSLIYGESVIVDGVKYRCIIYRGNGIWCDRAESSER